jgi:hypothetical protein
MKNNNFFLAAIRCPWYLTCHLSLGLLTLCHNQEAFNRKRGGIVPWDVRKLGNKKVPKPSRRSISWLAVSVDYTNIYNSINFRKVHFQMCGK